MSAGHPGSRNDKTIAKTDSFLQKLRRKEILQDVEFDLFQSDGTTKKAKGAYLITDNGYARWRILQCPIKISFNRQQMFWSARLESVRKDVECTFGILKGRFRILGGNVLFHDQWKVDNVFIACCILHNMNLVEDGRHVMWQNPSNWEIAEDDDDEDIRQARELLRSKGRLIVREDPVFIEEDRVISNTNDEDADNDYFAFRSDLIDHYTYCSNLPNTHKDKPIWI
jgi:hypothetical protein